MFQNGHFFLFPYYYRRNRESFKENNNKIVKSIRQATKLYGHIF